MVGTEARDKLVLAVVAFDELVVRGVMVYVVGSPLCFGDSASDKNLGANLAPLGIVATFVRGWP